MSTVDEAAEILSATADEWIGNYYRAADILAAADPPLLVTDEMRHLLAWCVVWRDGKTSKATLQHQIDTYLATRPPS